jgi:hypothetical protein
MHKKIFYLLFAIFIGGLHLTAHANDPILRFSDLISGPDTGLGDGSGSGVIVTVWGQFLGDFQGDSKISFVDSAGQERDAAFVYYWKRADGQLPSGPSNLYASHRMQEIAFSIPDSAPGLGSIKVSVNGRSSTLPFFVRDGKIFHIKESGDDVSGDGSFSTPWKTVAEALRKLREPGITLYIHDVTSGCENCQRGIQWAQAATSSSLEAQFGFVAYPGTRPITMGARGFTNFRVNGQVISKFDVYSSNFPTVDASGQPTGTRIDAATMCIETDAFGRVVGNRCTDIPGGCASGQQAAIVGNALNENEVDLVQILGNEIYDYGCQGSSKHQHTTYMSVRSGANDLRVQPWRFGWNYLHGNHTNNGIHQFDEAIGGGPCGSPVGTVVINDNVIIDQSGSGINVGASCPWEADFDIYNNVLINTGLINAWDGVNPETADGANVNGINFTDQVAGLFGIMNVFNNTIYKWNDDEGTNGSKSCLGLTQGGDNVTVLWNNNICLTEKDKAFVAHGFQGEVLLDNVTGGNNLWYYAGTAPTKAIAPTHWDATAVEEDPLLTITGPFISISENSPARNKSGHTPPRHDIYGVLRTDGGEIGAVEYNNVKIPNPPTSLTIK